MLQPSRALGDIVFKRKSAFSILPWQWQMLLRDKWTPPYVSASPEITNFRLTPNDRFLIIATDGLYQSMSREDVIAAAGDWFDNPAVSPILILSSPVSPSFTSHRSLLPSCVFECSILEFFFFYSFSLLFLFFPAVLLFLTCLLFVQVQESCPNLAVYLTREALAAASRDVFGDQHHPHMSEDGEILSIAQSIILQVPPSKKRMVHDDITIAVVMFRDPEDSPEGSDEVPEPLQVPVPQLRQKLESKKSRL